ncbi:amidase family protein [Microlunatus flavus]|uniref:amidase family protein n=1 Tax=Microlunatus flavus TaxID=1036181 RepID=UPI00147A074A|nr:amidase family protein [Microlunatus flavus]
MRTVIIGSGAVGGVVAGHLVRAGEDVLLCDADPEHVDALNAFGLRVVGPVEEVVVPVTAVLPAALPDHVERVLLAVKSHHTRSAVEPLWTRLAADGYVVTLQNGMTGGVVDDVLGPGRRVTAFVNFGADVVAPGVVAQGNVATVRVGEPGGGVSDRVRAVAALLPYAEATANIEGYLWSKEAYGAMLFATAVSDLTIADALGASAYRPLLLALAREVLDRAPASPEPFDGFDPADLEGSLGRLVAFNAASGKARTGVWRDLAVRHRPTEVDDLDGVGGPLVHQLAALVRAIERGERRCETANLDLLAAYERLERVGRPLAAVVEALPAPRRAAEGPLLGVQVAVKDMVDVEGVVRGNGNPRAMAEGSPAVQDAPVVARLRAAGADVFATAALLEYAAGAQHPGLDEARNPADPTRTAGGSSGGSAALVAAGVCAAALGTDTGGSIRIPASYCGCVGIKPTYDLVPVGGVTALSPSLDHVGVLAADVATAARVLGAVAELGPLPEAPAPGALRVGLLSAELADPAVEPGTRASVRAAVDRLVGAGAQVVEVDVAPLRALHAVFEPILLFEAWREHEALAADPAWFGPDTDRLLRLGRDVTPAQHRAALARRAELLPAADAMLDSVDVLLGPAVAFTAPGTTPVIDSDAGAVEGLFSMGANLTGWPALVLPCGADAGLPVGLQLMGRRGEDAALLAAATTIERVLAEETA